MSKQDQAAKSIGKRIVETYRATLVCTQVESDARHAKVAAMIDAAINRGKYAAVRKERERCVDIILESDKPGTPGKYERRYMLEAIVEKINAKAIRKGKAANGN